MLYVVFFVLGAFIVEGTTKGPYYHDNGGQISDVVEEE